MNISIVVPAFNEEKYIGRLFSSIEQLDIPVEVSLDVVVVLNRCTDGTENLCKNFGATILYDDSKNLSRIRNAGVAAAKGDWIITIDADSWISTNVVREIFNNIKTNGVIGGGVSIKPERWSIGIAVGYYMFLLPGLLLGFSFGLYWFKKDYFNKIDGFDESKLIAEDVDFMRRLKQYGRSIGKNYKKITSAHIVTSCRKFDEFGDWHFVRIFGNPCRVIRAIRGKDDKYLDDNWYEVKR